MTKSTQDLAAELNKLDGRRATLAADREAARGKLDAARGALVNGKLDAGKVTAAQSTYTALSEAVDALDARLKDTRAELAEAERGAELRAEAARGRARDERRRVLTAEIHALFESVMSTSRALSARTLRKSRNGAERAAKATFARPPASLMAQPWHWLSQSKAERGNNE